MRVLGAVVALLFTGVGILGWTLWEQRAELQDQASELRDASREIGRLERDLDEVLAGLEQLGNLGFGALPEEVADLGGRVNELESQVGVRSVRAQPLSSLWDEVGNLSDDLASLEGCVDSIANVVRGSGQFIFC